MPFMFCLMWVGVKLLCGCVAYLLNTVCFFSLGILCKSMKSVCELFLDMSTDVVSHLHKYLHADITFVIDLDLKIN